MLEGRDFKDLLFCLSFYVDPEEKKKKKPHQGGSPGRTLFEGHLTWVFEAVL